MTTKVSELVVRILLGQEIFAIPASQVHEIVDCPKKTLVPGSDPFVQSLINVRGHVVPLADLRYKLRLDISAKTIDTRIVVLDISSGDDNLMVGIIADKVFEILEVDLVVEGRVPQVGMRWPPDYVRSMGRCNGEFLMILDTPRIFDMAWDNPPAIV